MEPGGQPGRKAAAQRSRAHQHHAGLCMLNVVLHAGGVSIGPEIPQRRIVVYGDLADAVVAQFLGKGADAVAHQHRLDLEAQRSGQFPGLADQFQTDGMQPSAADLGKHEDVVPLGLIHVFHLGL